MSLQFNMFSLRISLFVNTVLATLGRYIALAFKELMVSVTRKMCNLQ